MSMKEHPSEDESIERDTTYSPASDTETRERQKHPADSPATADPEVDDAEVKVLPGTGGPDDSGDVDVDPDDIDFDAIRRDDSSR
ncbi:hypothetical protein ACX3O0_02445 [Homoserinimonas sp. A447]